MSLKRKVHDPYPAPFRAQDTDHDENADMDPRAKKLPKILGKKNSF